MKHRHAVARLLFVPLVLIACPAQGGGAPEEVTRSAVTLPQIQKGVEKAWCDWKHDNSKAVKFIVETATREKDPALGVHFPTYPGLKYLQVDFAHTGDKRYKRYTTLNPSSPRDIYTDARYLYDGKTSWEVHRRSGARVDGKVKLWNLDFYGDLVGAGMARGTRTIQGDSKFPFRIDEVLRSGKYHVAAAKEGESGLVVIERKGLDRIALDPKRGFAIVKRRWHWDLDAPMKVSIANSDFREVTDGLWLPFRSRIEFYGTPKTKPGKRCAVAKLRVTDLVTNPFDREFDGLFQFDDAYIMDNVTNTRYKISGGKRIPRK